MNIAINRILLAMMLAALSGCASTGAINGPHAECLVCKHNADLACVDIPVTADTPRVDYQGQTYYFCGDTCKNEFVKNPGKYLAAK